MNKLKGGKIYLKKNENRRSDSPVQRKQKLFERAGILILKDKLSNIVLIKFMYVAMQNTPGTRHHF